MSVKPEGYGEQQPNHRQLLEILETSGFKVHEPPIKDQLPVTISQKGFENLSSQGIKVLGELVGRSRDYLSGVFVEDTLEQNTEGSESFAARQQRTDRWSSLEKKYGEEVGRIKRSDKLKLGSSVGGLKTYFEWFVKELDAVPIRSFRANSARNLYARFLATIPFGEKEEQMTVTEEYNQMKFSEKVAVAQRIDGVLRDFLKLVTIESSGREVDIAE